MSSPSPLHSRFVRATLAVGATLMLGSCAFVPSFGPSSTPMPKFIVGNWLCDLEPAPGIEPDGEQAEILVDDTGVIEVTYINDDEVEEEHVFLYTTSKNSITTDDNAGGGWTIATPSAIEDGDKRKVNIEGIGSDTAETPTITYDDGTVAIDSLYSTKWECRKAKSGS
jgi:hypothetical protein